MGDICRIHPAASGGTSYHNQHGEGTDLPTRPLKEPCVTDAIITADQPIAEAVRSLLAHQLGVLLEQEAAYWTGDRKDAVHRMRVALRRMRALLRLHGDRFTGQSLKPLTTAIRKAGRALGRVRDLDVFIAHLTNQEGMEPDDLDDLVAAWKKRRRKARRRLTAYLRGKSYRTLIEVLAEFTSVPGKGVRPPTGPHAPVEVRHVLGTSLWSRYEAVWAYGPLLGDASMETLHDLRIECKYLRYALEFFQPILNQTKSAQLIATVVDIQDHLGHLHDAAVAGEMLAGDEKVRGRDAYLAAREADVDRLLQTFPPLWKRIDSLGFRRDLASLFTAL